MKISKKIFGVALALIMILNVFAVGTSAAVPADTVVDLRIRTDKTTYAPGDEVILTFSYDVIDDLTEMLIGGQYEIGYNSAVLEPYSTSIEDISAHGYEAHQAGTDLGSSCIQIPAQSTGPSALYDWNTTICYVVVDDGTGYNACGGVDVFSIKMKIKADAPDGTYTIGYNPLGYEECNGYVNDNIGLGGLYGTVPDTSYMPFDEANMYAFGTCTFTVSSAPAVEVTHVGEQAKWNGGDANNTPENYLFGFIGQVTGLEVETELQNGHNVVTNIDSIVATAQCNGSSIPSTVITMWPVDGGYQFRAVFGGFLPSDTNEISVTFAITMTDGVTTYTTADASVDTANAIYEAAVSRGMPAVKA